MTPQEYEAEISRLTQGYEDLRATFESHKDYMWRGFKNDYDKGFSDCAHAVCDAINKITGNEK